MRIVHVIEGLKKAAGTSVFCAEACNHLAALGHEVVIACNLTRSPGNYPLDPRVRLVELSSFRLADFIIPPKQVNHPCSTSTSNFNSLPKEASNHCSTSTPNFDSLPTPNFDSSPTPSTSTSNFNSLPPSTSTSNFDSSPTPSTSTSNFNSLPIIHLHGIWPTVFHRIAAECRRLGVPYFWSTHGMTAPWSMHHKWWKKLPAWWLYQRWDLRGAAAIHCTVPMEVEWNEKAVGVRCFVAPLGTRMVVGGKSKLGVGESKLEVEVEGGEGKLKDGVEVEGVGELKCGVEVEGGKGESRSWESKSNSGSEIVEVGKRGEVEVGSPSRTGESNSGDVGEVEVGSPSRTRESNSGDVGEVEVGKRGEVEVGSPSRTKEVNFHSSTSTNTFNSSSTSTNTFNSSSTSTFDFDSKPTSTFDFDSKPTSTQDFDSKPTSTNTFNSSPLTILFVGRIYPVKALDNVIRAAAILKAKGEVELKLGVEVEGVGELKCGVEVEGGEGESRSWESKSKLEVEVEQRRSDFGEGKLGVEVEQRRRGIGFRIVGPDQAGHQEELVALCKSLGLQCVGEGKLEVGEKSKLEVEVEGVGELKCGVEVEGEVGRVGESKLEVEVEQRKGESRSLESKSNSGSEIVEVGSRGVVEVGSPSRTKESNSGDVGEVEVRRLGEVEVGSPSRTKEVNLHSSTSTQDFDSKPTSTQDFDSKPTSTTNFNSISVTFAGPKYDDELAAEYERCDCLILVSHTENFGATVIDAMAHGKPVITSTKTPWAEVAERGCGWWVDNDPETLAKTFAEFAAKAPEERAEMGRRGRRLVEEKYTWPAIARRLEEEYERVVGGES